MRVAEGTTGGRRGRGVGLACSPFFCPHHKGDFLEHLNASTRTSLRSLLSPSVRRRLDAELFGRRVAK